MQSLRRIPRFLKPRKICSIYPPRMAHVRLYSSNIKTANRDLLASYSQQWEPKLLRLKSAMNTDMNESNIADIANCHQQIDEINTGLKELCESVTQSSDPNIDSLNQNVSNLHQQLQDKTKMNQKLQDEIANLNEEIQAYEQHIDELQANVNALHVTTTTASNERDALQQELQSVRAALQALKDSTNTSNESQSVETTESIGDTEQSMDAAQEEERVSVDEEEMSLEERMQQTKQDLIGLLQEFHVLENRYNRLRIICLAFFLLIFVAVTDGYKTRKRLNSVNQELFMVQTKMNDMFYFNKKDDAQ